VIENEVAHQFDNILSYWRMSRVIEEHSLPPEWRAILVDRYRNTIAHQG